MNKTLRLIAYGAIAFALVGCGASGGSNAPAPNTIANLNSNTLQVAVGTVNLYGAANAGLNVVTTYRQTNGKSGTLLNSPTLTLPAATGLAAVGAAGGAAYDPTSTILAGPATAAEAAGVLGSTSQAYGVNCATAISTFGQSGGVFGLGIEPYNSTSQADCLPPGVSSTGTPFQVAPYPVPLYDTTAGDPNAFVPWGGPPAFTLVNSGGDSVVGSSNYPTGTAGISEGIDVFKGVAAVANSKYTLSVAVPANTGTTTQTASFTTPAALTNLPTVTSPAYVPDAAGGGTFVTPALPAGGITEAYLQLTDFGPAKVGGVDQKSCNAASTAHPVYYTIETTTGGTLTLPDTIGPGGAPSVCTATQNAAVTTNAAGVGADQLAIQVIGFDYDAFSATYNASVPATLTNAAPALTGANNAADMTIGAATCQAGAVNCTASLPLLRGRALHAAGFKRF